MIVLIDTFPPVLPDLPVQRARLVQQARRDPLVLPDPLARLVRPEPKALPVPKDPLALLVPPSPPAPQLRTRTRAPEPRSW